MSDNVSDLVFRDLDPDIPASRTFDDKWEASLREELERGRARRRACIPAADTATAAAPSGR